MQQCYKAQSRLSEQLVTEVAEGRVSKSVIQEKETTLANFKKEFDQIRLAYYVFHYEFLLFITVILHFILILNGVHFSNEYSELKMLLDEKTKGLELVTSENQELKRQLEEISLKVKSAEAENKMLIDRWMLQKMQDAERLNEVIYVVCVNCQAVSSVKTTILDFKILCGY